MRTTSERRGPSPSGLTYPAGHPLRVRRVSRVTFFAFLGLGITFTKDLANPSRQLPRTVYLALAVAAINYVAIAFGVSAPDCEERDGEFIPDLPRPEAGARASASTAVLKFLGEPYLVSHVEPQALVVKRAHRSPSDDADADGGRPPRSSPRFVCPALSTFSLPAGVEDKDPHRIAVDLACRPAPRFVIHRADHPSEPSMAGDVLPPRPHGTWPQGATATTWS